MTRVLRLRAILVVCLGLGAWDCRAATVCAGGDTLAGIDVSRYDGSINWSSVAADGIDFAYIRVANGSDLDSHFSSNWDAARTAGVIRGAVQILKPDENAVDQAQALIEAIGSLEPGDLPPAVAVEINGGQSAATITTRVGQWLAHVESAFGLPPVIYTGYYFWEDSVGSSDYSDHPLWIAHYTNASCPTLPSQWSDWVFWQKSSTGAVNGVNGNVNINIFNGDLAALAKLGQPETCEGAQCFQVFEDGFESAEAPLGDGGD